MANGVQAAPMAADPNIPVGASRALACGGCRVRGWTICAPLSDRELATMNGARGGRIEVPPGADLVRQGEAAVEAFTVLEGWAMRYVLLADGERQMVGDTAARRTPSDGTCCLSCSCGSAPVAMVVAMGPRSRCRSPRNTLATRWA